MSKLKLRAQFFKRTNNERLYGLDIAVIGLTGSIATGKSTASKILKDLGHPVIDADKLVKDIYKSNEAIEFLKIVCPETVTNGSEIIFPQLREVFFSNSKLKSEIESFIYQRLERQFLCELSTLNLSNYIIYDVPLLFEKKLESKFDQTICIYSSKSIQLQRLISRDNITAELAKNIIETQISIDSKKTLCDIAIANTDTREALTKTLSNLNIFESK
jgi:dephospho-CoA kinase